MEQHIPPIIANALKAQEGFVSNPDPNKAQLDPDKVPKPGENAGFLAAKPSPWTMFHDIDMLVDVSFFSHLSSYLASSPPWIQPYTQKRVMLLPQGVTNQIQASSYAPTDLQLAAAVPADPGSTGGRDRKSVV